MATGAIFGTFPLFWGVMLISLFSPISGNQDRHQAWLKRADELAIQTVRTSKAQPDIAIVEKKTVPLEPFTPQAIVASDELLSTVLSELESPYEMPPKVLVWKKRKFWLPDESDDFPLKKRRTVHILTKRTSEDGEGGLAGQLRRRQSSILGMPTQKKVPFESVELTSRTSWRKLSQRLQRSVSSLHGEENNLEERYWHNRLIKSQEQRRRDTSKAKIFRKKRDTEITVTPMSSSHLQLSALKTQMKLSEIVEQLANPTTRLTEAEKLAYMRELLQELKLFIKLLQEQVQLELKEKAKHLAKASPSPL